MEKIMREFYKILMKYLESVKKTRSNLKEILRYISKTCSNSGKNEKNFKSGIHLSTNEAALYRIASVW